MLVVIYLQVTKRLDTDEGDWAGWDWRSDGDVMVNGAYFVPSGQGNLYTKDSGAEPRSAAMIDRLTSAAGVLGGPRYTTHTHKILLYIHAIASCKISLYIMSLNCNLIGLSLIL